jgi:type I restriction enzyme R subunit
MDAYANTDTPKKCWSIWKEEQDEAHAGGVKTLIDTAPEESLLPDFYAWRKNSYWVRQAFQEKATACPPSRTAPSSGCSTLPACWNWSTNSSSTMRVRRKSPATSTTLDRVAALNAQGERTGGVIWHTTGSGKSLTMVMLAKALVLHPNIKNPRVVLITDRVNFDAQIYKTFANCGKDVVQAQSGRHLIELVQSTKADIIATVIN